MENSSPKLPELSKQINYLCRRKYPFSWAPPPISPVGSRSSNSGTAEEHQKFLHEKDAYENELLKKSIAEINKLYLAEIERELDQRRAEFQADQKRQFFNQPYAMADFDYWGKMSLWTLDEGVALILGRNPKMVTWDKIKTNSRAFVLVTDYENLMDIVVRARLLRELSNPVKPQKFLNWLQSKEIAVPTELLAAVLKYATEKPMPIVPTAQPALKETSKNKSTVGRKDEAERDAALQKAAENYVERCKKTHHKRLTKGEVADYLFKQSEWGSTFKGASTIERRIKATW